MTLAQFLLGIRMLQCWLFLQDGPRLIAVCFCVDVWCLNYFCIGELLYCGFVGADKRARATEGRGKSLPSRIVTVGRTS